MSAASHDTNMEDLSDSEDGQELLLGNEKKLVIVSHDFISSLSCFMQVFCMT
jgi:hypothetical protein